MTDISEFALEKLREDSEFALYQGSVAGKAVLFLAPNSVQPTSSILERLRKEHALSDCLDPAWAVRPLGLATRNGHPGLLLEDPGARPLDDWLGTALPPETFLPLAIELTAALRGVHAGGFVHMDVRPANVIVDAAGKVRLTGFGLSARLSGAEKFSGPSELAFASLAYMSPERTGSTKQPVDWRTDLYSLGVTFYEMLAGELPFKAAGTIEWIHSHVARAPTPLSERVAGVPLALEALVTKLMAKEAADRYQTAAAVEEDLRHAMAALAKTGRIEPFTLGEADAQGRLKIGETLYGRTAQLDRLLETFESVAISGESRVVLISGAPGIGKSSLVEALKNAPAAKPTLFAAAKFDQYKRDIPYLTLAEAFEDLIRQMLGSDEADLNQWRRTLLEAVNPNGAYITNIIPELSAIIGEQPPAPELPAQDRQRQLLRVFRRFVGAFARPGQPLILFLDDLQWMDLATLDLIVHLAEHPEVDNLLLIGAHRDSDAGSHHPVARLGEAIRRAGGEPVSVELGPLQPSEVEILLADALQAKRERVRGLARLVFNKTGGNPFFTTQFIVELAQESLLAYDPDVGAWTWSLRSILAKKLAHNIAELMSTKLGRLPPQARTALGQLACLGSAAAAKTLALVCGESQAAVDAILKDAVRAGLLLRATGRYWFLHDRIQEAAYSLVSEQDRAAAHLRIGRLLAGSGKPEELGDKIFDVVSQFERASALLEVAEDGEAIAALYLVAAKRAKAATAYLSAARYLAAGRVLLGQDSWTHARQLTFDLELNLAECEYLTGELALSEGRLAALSDCAEAVAEYAAVTSARVDLYLLVDRSDRAVEVGLQYLRRVVPQWNWDVTEESVHAECVRLLDRLGPGIIEALVDIQRMADTDKTVTMNVLAALIPPAQFTDAVLFRAVLVRMMEYAMAHGNSDESCLAYLALATVTMTYIRDVQKGSRLGKLALDLAERSESRRFKGRVYSAYAVHISHWTQHLSVSQVYLRRAFEILRDAGDLTFASFAGVDLVTVLLASGEPLADAEREAIGALEFVQAARFSLIADVIKAQLQLIRALLGKTTNLKSFNDGEFDEGEFEDHVENDPRLAIAKSRYWIRKLQVRVLGGEYGEAVAAARKAKSMIWTLPSQMELPEYHFFAGLAFAGHHDEAPEAERPQHFAELAAHHAQLLSWAEAGPESFAHRATLLGAERARIEGREADAMGLYERAIDAAREQGYVQTEGMASELAARFHGQRGLKTIEAAYLRNARSCFSRWGALEKVAKLDRLRSKRHDDFAIYHDPRADRVEREQLDLTAVINVSQAVSGEVVLDRLIERLLKTVVEQSGAVRALLILADGQDLGIVAEATTREAGVEVSRRDVGVKGKAPQTVLNFVARTQNLVILEDARRPNSFSSDEYIVQARPKSVICVPLVRQQDFVGALYMENNLSSSVFSSNRVSLIRVIASQAAISIENAKLFSEVNSAKESARRLANELRQSFDMIPALAWSAAADGTPEFANKRWHDYTGIQPENLTGDAWVAAFHPDDMEGVASKWTELLATGTGGELEVRMRRYDGVMRTFLARVMPMRNEAGQIVRWYGTNIDIEDINRTREAQQNLTRAARLTAMGELTVSIAHEVNQPLMAIVTNAAACVQWLDDSRVNVVKARRAAERIMRDGHRAGDIISSIRALAKKSQPEMLRLDVKKLTTEVLALVRGELNRHGIATEVDIADDAYALGDRVQIQQVILNLTVNAVDAMAGQERRPNHLRIRAARDHAGFIEVAMFDTGIGLSQKGSEQIFDAFVTTKPEGIGMGLSICRSIIEAHGGRIWAHRNAPHGSAFCFTVPAYAGDDARS